MLVNVSRYERNVAKVLSTLVYFLAPTLSKNVYVYVTRIYKRFITVYFIALCWLKFVQSTNTVPSRRLSSFLTWQSYWLLLIKWYDLLCCLLFVIISLLWRVFLFLNEVLCLNSCWTLPYLFNVWICFYYMCIIWQRQ